MGKEERTQKNTTNKSAPPHEYYENRQNQTTDYRLKTPDYYCTPLLSTINTVLAPSSRAMRITATTSSTETVLSALIAIVALTLSFMTIGRRVALSSSIGTTLPFTMYRSFVLMFTTTFCFVLVSPFPFGVESLITFGLARVAAMRKNIRRIKRISFRGPVWTSACDFNFLRIFIHDSDANFMAD